MATLTDDELARIRVELGDHVLDAGALPYADYRAVYVIVRDHVVSSSVTPTSSETAVDAAGPTTLTLASVTGLSVGSRVQLDVDDARETVTVRAVVGSTISVLCRKTHGGTYPVEVESPLTIVRGILADLSRLEHVDSLDALAALGLKRVDEVEWTDEGRARAIEQARARLRTRLADACGLRTTLARNRSSSDSFEVY